MNREFDAPWDRALTIGTTVALVGAGLVVVVTATATFAAAWPAALPALVLPAVFLLAFLRAPAGYAVEDGDLVMRRRLGEWRLPLREVRAVHLLPPSAARGLLRVAGSGGLFGYFGRYWSRDLGGFRLMATRRTGLVLVETSGGRVVLSPGEPAAFREAVLGAAPWIARAPALALTPSGSPGRAVALVVALVLTLLGVGLGLAIGWSPTGAIVDAGDIRISRRLAPTVVIPLSEVRRISLLPPGQARGWRRTSGTSFGQVRYGRFESEALGPFRLYAWRGGPYLLLETDDGPVVLTPDDPEGFAAQARAGAGLER